MASVRILRHLCVHGSRVFALLRAKINPMSRRDWLLILCAYQGAPAGLDPVRVQKGMFLFARTGQLPAQERYEFRPYDYGPMSPTIYSDLDALAAEGLLEPHPVSGKQWSRYTATEKGRRTAEGRLEGLSTDAEKSRARWLYEIKQRVASLSFNDLLEQVYSEHPDMAVNSVFRRLI
jgi:uncharacterized protein YwgA